ncbi:MAG: DMT family transporter [Synergistales bacterium]|jgi:drug/metabolite transporter (DMT)-like permease
MRQPEKPFVHPIAALSIGIAAISTGAIFARAADAPSLTIAAYRVGLATLILAPLFAWKCPKEIAGLNRSDWKAVLGAGFFLAVHFATWIASLDYTSVASSVVLVETIPLWVGILTPFVTGERPGKGTLAGIGLSFAGGLLIGAGDFALGGRALLGDALALAGGFSGALYIMLGRNVRPRLSLLAYVTTCYGTAGALLWALVLASKTPFTGFSVPTWWAFAGMALIPQLIGHSSYNWALRWFSAGTVAVCLLGEPLGSTLLAWVFFGETLTAWKAAGGALILAGIVLAARSERS